MIWLAIMALTVSAASLPSPPTNNYVMGVASPTSTVTLAWTPPNDPTVTHFNLYYGIATRTYTNVLSTTASTLTVSNLVVGATYYFAATSVAGNGLESAFSNEASYTVPFVLAFISTFVETNLSLSLTGWHAAATFPILVLTNPPSPLFYRTRIAISYSNQADPPARVPGTMFFAKPPMPPIK